MCTRYKGYASRTSRLHSVVGLHRAGLSAPFSNHSCFVVFIPRAPGSHSTGLLSVSSSSPPALELLLPAPVYSALLSKPHLYKLTDYRPKKRVSGERPLELLWCFWPIQGQGMFLSERSTNWVGCLGCSWPKCPQDVTISVLWVIYFFQMVFGMFNQMSALYI